MAGKTVLQARPTGRKRVDHRNFCEEVARATTFTGAEVEGRTATRCRNSEKTCEERRYCSVWCLGTLTPSFQSKLAEKGKTEFNPNIHITKPVVRLSSSRKYFTLTGESYERVEAPAKKGSTKPTPNPTPKPDEEKPDEQIGL